MNAEQFYRNRDDDEKLNSIFAYTPHQHHL